MLGHAIPSPEAARKFLYQFHDPEKIAQAQRDLPVGEVSYVPEDSMALRGLAQVNQDVVRELARRCAGERIATIDMDATVIESWKREAKAIYEGGSGYQPMVALWAELNVAQPRQIDETTTVVGYPPPFVADDSSSHHQLP